MSSTWIATWDSDAEPEVDTFPDLGGPTISLEKTSTRSDPGFHRSHPLIAPLSPDEVKKCQKLLSNLERIQLNTYRESEAVVDSQMNRLLHQKGIDIYEASVDPEIWPMYLAYWKQELVRLELWTSDEKVDKAKKIGKIEIRKDVTAHRVYSENLASSKSQVRPQRWTQSLFAEDPTISIDEPSISIQIQPLSEQLKKKIPAPKAKTAESSDSEPKKSKDSISLEELLPNELPDEVPPLISAKEDEELMKIGKKMEKELKMPPKIEQVD